MVLAKDQRIQELLSKHDINIKTLDEVAPIEVHPAKVLSYMYSNLGEKLGK